MLCFPEKKRFQPFLILSFTPEQVSIFFLLCHFTVSLIDFQSGSFPGQSRCLPSLHPATKLLSLAANRVEPESSALTPQLSHQSSSCVDEVPGRCWLAAVQVQSVSCQLASALLWLEEHSGRCHWQAFALHSGLPSAPASADWVVPPRLFQVGIECCLLLKAKNVFHFLLRFQSRRR